MEEFYSEETLRQQRTEDQSPPFHEFEVKHETPEEIVAQNVSQQLLSNALELQRKESEAQEVPHKTSTNQQTIAQQFLEEVEEPKQPKQPKEAIEPKEHFNQNIEIQSEHRFSGIPLQQYIYDEEEEDEEESDPEMEIQPIEKQRTQDLLDYSLTSDQKENDNSFDLLNEPKSQPNEEILYHLSDDNVLTAQSYGIKSDLRIDSFNSEPKSEVSEYELNSEDPFSTPQKQKIETNKERQQLETLETFAESQVFNTADDYKPKQSLNLLDFDQSLSRVSESKSGANDLPLESHSMVDSMIDSIIELKSDSEIESNHALSSAFDTVVSNEGTEVLPSSVVDTELLESQIEAIHESTNKSETDSSRDSSRDSNPDFNSTPNLDFEPTLTSNTHLLEEAFPTKQSISQPIETIEELPITSTQTQSTKAAETQKPEELIEVIEEIEIKDMSKHESSPPVTTSSNESKCPFSPSALFNTQQLNPSVAELVYWRDPKKSGVVFGAGLAILLSLTVFSIISVIAYSSLAVLSVTLSFRIYKNILQAVQKTNEGHPFKEYLEIEITPSSERIHEIVDSVLSHMNCTLNKLRSVFLVEDIIDSLKFVVLFWCLTYIGSWFNGLTLVILVYLGLFSLPKVYEMNKTQIDQYLSLASTQINEITSKIRAKIPFPAKKEKDN